MRLAAFVLPTLLSISLSLQAHTGAKVNFYPGTFHELRKEAFEEDKPYVLYFSFAGEEASREMETYTFLEPRLSHYISQNYLIYKVSAGNTSRGNDFMEKDFNVHASSLIIFDAKSYELERIKGFVDPEFLLNSLRKHKPERGINLAHTPIANTTDVELAPSTNLPIIEDLGPNTAVRRIADEFFTQGNQSAERDTDGTSQASDKILIIDQYGTDPQKPAQKEDTNRRWKRENSFDESEGSGQESEILTQRFDFEEEQSSADYSRPYTRIPVPAEQYEKKIPELQTQEKDWISAKGNNSYAEEPYHAVQNPHQKRGFGIQTGVFSESYFMRKEVDFLQSKFSQDVFVKKARLNGKEVYKVQVGPFSSEAAARSFEKVFRRVSGNRKGMLVYIQ